MFFSGTNFVTHKLPPDIVIISDHTLCGIGTNTNITSSKPTEVKNIYSTEIYNYNLMGVNKEEWKALNEYLFSIDWNVVFYSVDINEHCEYLINILEIGVKGV